MPAVLILLGRLLAFLAYPNRKLAHVEHIEIERLRRVLFVPVVQLRRALCDRAQGVMFNTQSWLAYLRQDARRLFVPRLTDRAELLDYPLPVLH